ncbi:conserved hypothetical protein [Methanococcus vannielii SB]|uniref:Uncharacterized protein n=1 Tax=Methanococcus vannielii (strain ATCC 35089 / DSM 1224 / JCM 13029 / OCM 148 / SB) TaxID=406327 RepID=A6UP05_METVS|nr:DUF2226 domain-containing protein [Methanococcus vannielii]ABR54227.1 conserved hypothetical protein [Methanococcus vannielii SB]
MDIIEGKFVKMGSDYNEIFDGLPNNFLGYIRVSMKINGGFKEGYLFLKDKKIIGGYSNFEEELFGNSAIIKTQEIAKKSSIIDIFLYTEQMLNMMENTNNKVFSTVKNSEKVEPSKNVNLKTPNSVKISIPEGNPIKLGIYENYEDYFKKYSILEIFKKVEGGYLRGYIAYNGKIPVCAIYVSQNSIKFGNSAMFEFKKMIDENEDLVFDVYEYSKSKIDYFIESYPESEVFFDNVKNFETVKSTLKVENQNESTEKNLDNLNSFEKPKIEEESISRDELMKKLGIKTVNDEMIENLLEDIFEPTKIELESIKAELLEKITEYLKNNNEISEFNVKLAITYDKEFNADCNVYATLKYDSKNLESKLNPDILKLEIKNIFNNYVIDINPDLTINTKLENNASIEKSVEDLENIINGEISGYLKNSSEVSEFEVYLKIKNEDGYVANCSITIVPAKMFGIIKSNPDIEKIKKYVFEIINTYNIKIDFLNVKVDKITTSIKNK